MRYFIIYSSLILACGPRAVVGRVEDQPFQAYLDQRATAIGTSADGGNVSVLRPDGNGCIEVVNGACIQPTRTGTFCEGTSSGPVDVVAVDGETKISVCYPSPNDSKSPIAVLDPSQTVSVAKTANGAAITFDPVTDGKPIAGPIVLSANNVSLYGNGPDRTIIEGDLVLEKNNARVRGVRVKGNLIVKYNDCSVILTQVDGNLVSDKNNGLYASNTVFGDMTVSGANNQLYYNNVQGQLSAPSAASGACAHNRAFTDVNRDQVLQSAEEGAEISCN